VLSISHSIPEAFALSTSSASKGMGHYNVRQSQHASRK
jgi:hypothetical protein